MNEINENEDYAKLEKNVNRNVSACTYMRLWCKLNVGINKITRNYALKLSEKKWHSYNFSKRLKNDHHCLLIFFLWGRVYKPLPKNTDGMPFKINLTEGEQYLWMVHCSCVGLPLYNMYVNGVDVTSLIVDQIQFSKLVSYTWYMIHYMWVK